MTKQCANPRCKKQLIRKPKEEPSKWLRRRYCSRQCATNVYGYRHLGRTG